MEKRIEQLEQALIYLAILMIVACGMVIDSSIPAALGCFGIALICVGIVAICER